MICRFYWVYWVNQVRVRANSQFNQNHTSLRLEDATTPDMATAPTPELEDALVGSLREGLMVGKW